MPTLSCRFYKNKFPDTEDTVVANVRSIAEMGAYVHLVEYNNIEGMILLSELSRRRIRSVNKLVRVGRTENVKVIRVDTDKGYIDLSKRRVDAEQKKQCHEQYSKAKLVASILRHTAEILGFETDEQLEDLHERTAWHFDEKFKRKTASYDVFKQAVQDPSVLDELTLSEKEREVLMTQVKRRLAAQPLKIRSDIEVSCFSYEGIDAVREALKAGLALSTEEIPVKINLIAPPVYVVTCTSLDRTEGLGLLAEAVEKIEENIKAAGGNFSIVMSPKVVSAHDEEELARQMEKAERDNAEVSGDDDEEEEEVGMGGGKDIGSGSGSESGGEGEE